MNRLLSSLEYLAATCPPRSNILNLPNWYRGLECDSSGQVMFQDINNLWIVIANVMDITLRLAAIIAVLVIIYGGIRYITSQGQPESLQAARKLIVNAIVGLVIAMLASTLVGFIAGLF